MFVLADQLLSCGNLEGLPAPLANFTSALVTILKILVPIIIIILGMMDLTKGMMSQKEDEIKKSQMMFVKRLIAGILVFFVVSIVQFAFTLVGNAGVENVTSCIPCFISGSNSSSACKVYEETTS